MTDKEQIICKYKFQDKEKFDGKPYCTCFNELCKNLSFVCDQNCIIYEDYKQLARKTQIVEQQHKTLDELIGCVSLWEEFTEEESKLAKDSSIADLIMLLRKKTQECEQIKEKYEALKLENQEGYEIVAELKHECEELKKEIINKNEKIKELRLSVSDLTNRLCYLNAEKSFRIVDLEQALDEIAAHYQKVIKNITNYDDSYDASISIKALHNISDIINKAKGEGICNMKI